MSNHDPARPLYYFSFLSNFDVIHSTKIAPGESAMSAGLTWSIAVEEQFYLLWPLLLQFTPTRLRAGLFFSILCVSALFRATHSYDSVTLCYHSLSVISDLTMGGLAAFYALESKAFLHFFRSLAPRSVLAIYGLGTILLIYSLSAEASVGKAIFGRLFVAAFFAFLILEQNFGSWERFRFSNNTFFTFWGKYTYGLYLLHAIALTILSSAMKALHVSSATAGKQFLYGLIGLLFSFLFSFVSYRYLETPFLELKKRFTYVKKA
jgi:peptidoglycan/LPS O-acetylase OafA/YrhL